MPGIVATQQHQPGIENITTWGIVGGTTK